MPDIKSKTARCNQQKLKLNNAGAKTSTPNKKALHAVTSTTTPNGVTEETDRQQDHHQTGITGFTTTTNSADNPEIQHNSNGKSLFCMTHLS